MANTTFNFQNLARYVLDADITALDTSVEVTWDGATTEAIETPYIAVLHEPRYPNPVDDPNVEIVNVTDNISGTLTVTRAQESTTAASHSSGDYLTPIASAQALNDIFEIIRKASNDRFVQFEGASGGGTDYNAGREDSADTFRITHGAGMDANVLCESGTDGWAFKAPDSAISDGRLQNNFVHFWIDEDADKLTFRVRYSDATLHTGTIDLV